MCQGERVDPNDDLTCYRSRVVNELIREKNRLYLFDNIINNPFVVKIH